MKRLGIILISLVVFASCSKKEAQQSEVQPAVKVVRGAHNQPSLLVGGRLTAVEADRALFEEQGYVTAQDRLFQMDILRRVSQGRLSELTGTEKAFEKDTQTLGLGILDAVENSAQKTQFQHTEIYSILVAYAAGVNRFINALPTEKPELLRQYRALTKDPNYLPAAWEPKDSISIMSSLAFYLSSSFKDKLAWGMIAKILTLTGRAKEFRDLLDLRPLEQNIIVDKENQFLPSPPPAPVADEAGGTRSTKHQTKASTKLAMSARQLKRNLKAAATLKYTCSEDGYPMPECGRKAGFGSNNWVVSSDYAGGGASYLANDPHLPLTFPMTFFEIALDSTRAGGTIHTRGVVPPGLPGILIGHNADVAWGLTNLTSDVDDLYVEQLDRTRTKYRINGKLKDLKIINRTVRFRLLSGKVEDRTVVVKYSEEHGPIFTDHIPKLRDIVKKVEQNGFMGKNLGLSYKWVGHVGSAELAAVIGMNRAKDYTTFKESLQFIEAGAQNVIFADKSGNIGYYAHGNFPVRKYLKDEIPPFQYIDQIPEVPSYEWEPEFRKGIPEIYRKDGYIVTANNDPFGHTLGEPGTGAKRKGNKYEDYFGFGFADGVRAHRIAERIQEAKTAKGVLTVEDMQSIQLDQKDLLALHFIDIIENSKVRDKLSDNGKVFYDQMTTWKAAGGVASRDRYEPVSFYEWLNVLEKEFYKYSEKKDESVFTKRLRTLIVKQDTQDELVKEWGEIMKFVYITSPAIKTLFHKLNDSVNLTKGPEFDSTVDLIKRTIELAVENVRKSGKQNVPWGSVNRLLFANSLDGILPQSFSLGLERGGSYETVNVAGPGFGPNFRLVMTVKPGADIQARIAVPGGNYGAFEIEPITQELKNWRDGAQRDLVDFQ